METAKRKIVPRMDFVMAVKAAKENGTGIQGISDATGLKPSSVNTRLYGLRKQLGKENVPTFQGGGGNKVSDAEKARLIAILQGQAV